MKQKTKVVFRKKTKDKNSGYLYIRITENRESKYKSLDIQLNKIHWDKDNQRVLPSYKNGYKLMNEKIINSLDDLGRANNNIKALNTGNTIITEYWEKHNHTTTNAGTKGNRKANLNKFKAFLKDENIEGLKFHQLTTHIVELYENYLFKQLAKRSVNTYLGYFKSVVNKAIRQLIVSYTVHPFIGHKRLTNQNKKARSLTIEQVKKLIDISLPPKTDYYRNMFMFQILGGGLRVRDLITIKWSNIEVNNNGVYIHYFQSKTKKEIKTKLSYKALEPLTLIFHQFQPQKMQGVKNIIEMLNTQLELKSKWKTSNKYNRFDNDKVKEYRHYDSTEKRYYNFTEASTSEVQQITLDQNIKMYLEDLNHEYGALITSINKDHSNNYIFNLMDGIALPENNTDEVIKNQIQGKIAIYNYHLKKICDKLNIPHFTSHTARHTFAQVLVNSNINLFYIQQFLGHSSMEVTQNYVRALDTQQLDDVSDTLANHF